jgi:transcriptional regulator with XRE-family HTH domain
VVGDVLPVAELGERLRRARTARGWSLAELAEQSGLSKSFLSLVENGNSDISMGRLARLLDTFQLTLAELTEQPSPASDGTTIDRFHVLRREDQPILASPSGIHTVVLARSVTHGSQRVLITFDPRASVDTSDFVGRRSGEGFLLMMAGSLVVGFRNGEHVTVGKGDSLVFSGSTVVSSRNDGRTRAVAYVEHPGF